jgi:hypothetical protein
MTKDLKAVRTAASVYQYVTITIMLAFQGQKGQDIQGFTYKRENAAFRVILATSVCDGKMKQVRVQ